MANHHPQALMWNQRGLELAEYRRRALPMNVTEGATVYYADLHVYRRFLTGGVLEPGAIVWILAEPGDQGRIELTPPK